MYQVLFAEDELLVRLGLQNSIPWEKYNMKLTAQADNGITAYELFLKIRPEVVITDIRMEGMDGYELIRKIRKIDQTCAIIIISCLDDFESLRKMMGYHISGYILKASMTMEEIYTVLEKVENDLMETIGTKNSKKLMECSLEESLKNYLLNKIEPDWSNLKWKDNSKFLVSEIKGMLLFRLKEEDSGKINELGTKFVCDLAERFLNKSIIVPIDEHCFCVITIQNECQVNENIRKMEQSIDTYLGVKFLITAHFEQEENALHSSSQLYEKYKYLLEKQQLQSSAKKYKEVLIERAVLHMQTHFKETLSLDDISRVIGISPSYFSYLFKRETKKNYIELLNEIRLEAVLKELKESEMKLMVIAERNGFHNIEYFSRYFKKQMGVSPAKWRILNKKNVSKVEKNEE